MYSCGVLALFKKNQQSVVADGAVFAKTSVRVAMATVRVPVNVTVTVSRDYHITGGQKTSSTHVKPCEFE